MMLIIREKCQEIKQEVKEEGEAKPQGGNEMARLVQCALSSAGFFFL